MSLKQIYNYLQMEPDPYTREWPMLSWYPITLFTLGYLCFIYIVGPRYMNDRPPYKLKSFILVYNIIQILGNGWIVKEHIRAGWFTKYGFVCFKPELDSPNAQVLRNIMWWILQLKFFDYIETCVFVLRKKQNQVSILHVYHHVSIVTFFWIFVKYIPDIRITLLTLLNCSVHVIMYTYYVCAASGPKLQQIVAPIKRYITIIQMVQFVVMLVYISQSLFAWCEVVQQTFKVYPYFSINLLIYFWLFYNFYKKNLIKKIKSKRN